MDFDVQQHGPWDVIVLAETAYYLGWLYTMFDIAWLYRSMYEAVTPGGRLLLVTPSATSTGS